MDYESKPNRYFDGARHDFVAALPPSGTSRILEIGCGFGATGALALAEGKCGSYFGIEISERAAEEARKRLTEVRVGNVESLPLDFERQSFDALIMSEVLEHLVDPWATLRKLHPFLRSGAIVMASSPNISHYQIIRHLLQGSWTLEDSGVMDRTHLRWFTPMSYQNMFEDTGFQVTSVKPLRPLGKKAALVDRLLARRFTHLFTNQICLLALKP